MNRLLKEKLGTLFVLGNGVVGLLTFTQLGGPVEELIQLIWVEFGQDIPHGVLIHNRDRVLDLKLFFSPYPSKLNQVDKIFQVR